MVYLAPKEAPITICVFLCVVLSVDKIIKPLETITSLDCYLDKNSLEQDAKNIFTTKEKIKSLKQAQNFEESLFQTSKLF